MSSAVKSSIITSPLYPKPYPTERSCHYVFEGRSDERIQLLFNDFQLHYSHGDAHEPHLYDIRLPCSCRIRCLNCIGGLLSALMCVCHVRQKTVSYTHLTLPTNREV